VSQGINDLKEQNFQWLNPSPLFFQKAGVFTPTQALRYISERLKVKKFYSAVKKSPIDDARDILTNTVLAHVPVEDFNFKMKAVFLALMIRRVIEAQNDHTMVDDRQEFFVLYIYHMSLYFWNLRDYYGNKRLELAGSLLSLLFEDLFKRLNWELKQIADKNIPKVKAAQFDIVKHIRLFWLSSH